MRCTNCGYESEAGFKFCPECGSPLWTAETVMPNAPTPPEAPTAPLSIAPEAPVTPPLAPPANESTGLSLGIVGVCLVAFNLNIAGLICSIIGLVKGKRAKRAHPENAEARASWTLGLVGTIFGGIKTAFIVMMMVLFGVVLSAFMQHLPELSQDLQNIGDTYGGYGYDYGYDYGYGDDGNNGYSYDYGDGNSDYGYDYGSGGESTQGTSHGFGAAYDLGEGVRAIAA